MWPSSFELLGSISGLHEWMDGGMRRCAYQSAREVANEKKTAVEFVTATGHRCCLSFTLSDLPKLSYLDIHWPLEGSAKPEPPYRFPAYPYLWATDKDLVLFDIHIPGQQCFVFDLPSDLFVYTAAGPSPSVKRLPPYTEPRECPFLRSRYTRGIPRLASDS
ncbi:hypothetical protein ZWY2020_018251 [Hordeum vulgare]|nr:hypothetical protein ZWY2020_018251 [Hordeum vulgare]